MTNSWFYTNVHYYGDKMYIKGYKLDGTPINGNIDYKPEVFVKGISAHPDEQYKSFDGVHNLRRKTFENYKELYEYAKEKTCYGLGTSSDKIIKTDLLYTFVSNCFSKGAIDFNMNHIAILNWDIETTSNEGFPNYLNPVEQILSISCSILKNGSRTYKTFGTKFCTDDKIENYVRCDDEKDMLYKFCKFVKKSNIDIITGWNCRRFDTPYFCARIEEYYDPEWLKMLSPFGLKPKRIHKKTKNRKTNQYEEYDVYNIPGISDLDMMLLYAKFDTYNGSLKLDNISEREIGEKKLDYSEYGSLNNLWKNDWNTFIVYNQKDIILVDKLVDKLKYIDLAVTIAYLAKIQYEDAFSPIKTWDNLIYNDLLNKKIIIPHMKSNEKTHQNRGGRVKDAKIGFSEHVVTTDATSLYPSIVISLNLSPETFVKKININEANILNMSDNTGWLKDANYCLASNGCLFDRTKQGVVSHLVSNIFEKRVEFKNLMKQEMKKENPDFDLVKKYDVFQYSLKILINSAYGILSSKSFRYFNLDVAEAITVTGQTIIQLSDKTINNYLNNYLENKIEKDYVIFSDTDSCGIELKEVVNKANNPENVVDYLDSFYNDNIDPEICKSLEKFSNYCNFYTNSISFKREKIIDKLVVIAKKKYFGICSDSEGYRYKEPEMFAKGVEIIRSSTPEVVKEPLKECMKLVLYSNEIELQKYVKSFKKIYNTFDAEKIAFPKGVNAINKYKLNRGYDDGTPIQVRAAILYNELIEEKNISKAYEKINDSDKIKFLYLKMPNFLFENVIGFKTFLPKEFGIDKYIDYNTMYEKTFISPLKLMLNSIGWLHERKNSLDI